MGTLKSARGTVLTPEVLDKLVAEAETGYDPATLVPERVRGRPSLHKGVSPRVSFRTTPRLYEAARERAAREGRSVSELAREAIERYVAG
ncbi:MAG: ribbon-helix-helix protein, CopG family [Actinomycetota bacterium]